MEDLDFRGSHSYLATEARPWEEAPVFIGTAEDVIAKVRPVECRALAFRTAGLALPADVSLAPFYRVHRERYAVYWRLMDRTAYEAEARGK